MNRLCQMLVTLCATTTCNTAIYAAPENVSSEIDKNRATIETIKQELYDEEVAQVQSDKNLYTDVINNWKALRTHTKQLKQQDKQLKEAQKTILDEGRLRAVGDAVLRQSINGNQADIDKNRGLIRENIQSIATVRCLQYTETAERKKADQDILSKICETRVAAEKISLKMNVRTTLLKQTDETLKTLTGKNQTDINRLRGQLKVQQNASRRQLEKMRRQVAVMGAYAKKERTALEQRLIKTDELLSQNDAVLGATVQGQANDIAHLRKQLEDAQLADAEDEENRAATATIIEVYAKTTATELNNLNATIDHNHKIAISGITQAMAQAALPQAYDGKNLVSIGGGHFKGENAVAIGFSKNFGSTNQYTVKISASSASKSSGGNIGFGCSF